MNEQITSLGSITISLFKAPWCIPCKKMELNLQESLSSFKDYNLHIINLDENYNLAEEYKIKTIPVVIIKNNEQILNKIVGLIPVGEIKSILSSYKCSIEKDFKV